MGERLRGGPEHKPSHNLENIADHVRALQEQGSLGGGITSPENQGPTPGEGEVPEGLIFYPGELSPRSPPDTLGESQHPHEPNKPADVLDKYLYLKQPEKLVKEAGWDNLAELLLDRAGFLEKPENQSIPRDDEEARDDAIILSLCVPAHRWEELTLKNLEAGGVDHLIPQFKQEMVEYRKSIKAMVDLWRKSGLL